VNDNESSALLDRQLAYLVFRLSLGISILIHGLDRFLGAGTESFASGTAPQFAAVPLPEGMIRAFLVTLPYAESIVGIFVTIGLFTRWALTIGGLLIVALIFGTALRADWPTVGIQMIYSIIYYLLLVNRSDNSFSVDGLIHRR
jgi:thiosulfate dehydrogenase (quinone) large subunit